MTLEQAIRALANEKRLQILDWLKDPRRHFAAMQVEGDVVKGWRVCGIVIARKLEVSQPTASEHLRILVQSGVLRPKRFKQWTFYKRDKRIRELRREIAKAL